MGILHQRAAIIRRRAAARTGAGARGLSVAEALVSYFAARADLVALTGDGRLWELEAPEGTALPYATFAVVAEATEARTTAGRLVRATVQVSLHHWTGQRAKDLAYAFEVALAGAPLVVSGAPVAHCLPGPPTSAIGEGKGDRGRDCRIEMFELDVLYSR